MILAWLVSTLSLVLAAACAIADGALLTASRDGQSREGSTLPHGDARERTHRALSIARLFAQISSAAAFAIAANLVERPMPLAIALGVVGVLLILVLGEILPREIGDLVGSPVLSAFSLFISVLELVMNPLVIIGAAIDGMLGRLLPAPPISDDRLSPTSPLRDVVAHGPQTPREQRAILKRVFSLGDTEVQEVMVPRVDIIGVERAMPWSEVVDRVRSSQHARLPVYDDTLDHVIGILYAKDLLAAVISDEEPAEGWSSLVRPASFIPESKAIDSQLRDFKSTRSHIAIVVDEYGGTAGLLTIEDILEEIVGDIRDENDWEEPPIVAEANTRFWVSGRVTLDELSEALGEHFEDKDITTVGGLIFQRLGRVPRAGESLTMRGFRVVVERVIRRRIDRLYFERLEAATVGTR
ncbi:MAG: HlyC/CorC family transporter [Gemmatimonadaceae bacterium]|nr:HlyC/CorC family transporter [Gemmatimonadaceae bacterium]